MKDFLAQIKAQAQKDPKRILFAEGTEPRVVEAAKEIQAQNLAQPILLTETPERPELLERYQEIRNCSEAEAKEALKNPNAYATLLLEMGEADALITGPTAPSKERIVPAFQIIKTKSHKASSFFIMVLDEDTDEDAANGGLLLFADCAVNIDPTAEELAQIAIDTAESAKKLKLDPKIAMLSFSTAGSTPHPLTQKMAEAAHLVKTQRPDLPIDDMETQADAALMDAIALKKAPHSKVAGHANVLIFPDLEAGNIAYKLVERLADATAIGPILQGLNKSVNELSRGASTEDIINLAALTSVLVQSQ